MIHFTAQGNGKFLLADVFFASAQSQRESQQ